MDASLTLPADQRRARVDARFGMAVFIGSWSMAFATLFLSFLVLRHREAHWPPPGVALPSLPVAGVATAVLLASSVLLQRALAAGRRAERAGTTAPAFVPLWASACVLALAFAALQTWLWVAVWNAGNTPESGVYASLFYMLTWFHALHVAGGLVALLWVAGASFAGRTGGRQLTRAGSVAVFWHFVDVVWLLLFLSFFVF